MIGIGLLAANQKLVERAGVGLGRQAVAERVCQIHDAAQRSGSLTTRRMEETPASLSDRAMVSLAAIMKSSIR